MLIFRRVRGHGMVPTMPPNTLVIGLRFAKKLKPGQIVIVSRDGKEQIKRIDQVKGEEVYLLGDHPETSLDSRQYGWLPGRSVRARVIWPRNKLD